MRRFQVGFFGLEGVALYAVVALGVALALSWAASGLAVWYLDGKLDTANERATQAESARASEEQSRKGFEAAATTCGASVQRLAAAGTKRDQLWASQLGVSNGKQEAAEARATQVVTAQRKQGETECDAIKRGLDEEIDNRAKR